MEYEMKPGKEWFQETYLLDAPKKTRNLYSW